MGDQTRKKVEESQRNLDAMEKKIEILRKMHQEHNEKLIACKKTHDDITSLMKMPSHRLIYEAKKLRKTIKDCSSLQCMENKRNDVTVFMKKYCGTNIKLSECMRIAEGRKTSCGWRLALGTVTHIFSVKILRHCYDLMVGFSPKEENLEKSNYTTTGYYLYCRTGGLYSSAVSDKAYSNLFGAKNGTIITGLWDKKNGTISFRINHKDHGIAFHTRHQELYPAFNIFTDDDEDKITNNIKIMFIDPRRNSD